MARRLILITGMPGSGKTTLAAFAEKEGYRIVAMGDVIRDLAEERELEPTHENLGSVAEDVRREEGPSAVARRCAEKLKGGEEKLVVDGIRSLEEVEAFREAFMDAALVAAHASPWTRFQRLRDRERGDRPRDRQAFHLRDRRELRFGLGSAVAMADYMIVNEGSLHDLERSFKDLLERLERG